MRMVAQIIARARAAPGARNPAASRDITFSILLCASCILFSACAGHPEPAQIGAPGNPIFASTPIQKPIDPVRLMLPGASSAPFAAADQSPAQTLRVELKATPPGSADWRTAQRSEFRAEKPGGPETLARVDSLIRTADGSIAMPRQTNQAENVEVIFDPPLIVLPASLKPGVPFVQSTTMTVHPIDKPTKVRAKGTVKQTITLEGRDRIRTPAGEFDAVKILSVFEADLGSTAVNNRTEQWLAEGAGLVAERRSERTTLVGVRIRSKDEFWLLDRRK